ncbi:hypothetical protein M427DRAFT_316914 [Gonapodya prolifera JEL478]|uniref:Galactose oxidase n=1 Tax=Gonapodya prolifera (strain JEL478) TaxID=1344416 RepID=A0A139AX92_GONPJ|nr:hypothetical protein M427DRAFT_316914 [Gonapodya prolifera JEL478]|eukprot:KXS21327.1 hypothetical protein M427DRAFT_316914 [Gonapodya prolifera JEL478]
MPHIRQRLRFIHCAVLQSVFEYRTDNSGANQCFSAAFGGSSAERMVILCSGVDLLPQIDSIYFSTVLGIARLPRNSTSRKFGDLKLTTQVNITGLTRGGSLTWDGSLCSQLKFEARGGHEEHFWVHGGFSSATVNTQVEPFYVWLSPLAPVANMWHMSTSNTANLDVLPTVGGPEFPEDPFGFSTAASVTTTDANSNFNAYYYYNASSQSQALMLYLPFRTTFNYNWTNASSVIARLPPREYQSMAQDDTGSRIFIYGGRNPRDGTTLNDLWVITTQGTNNYSAWQAMQVPIGVTANEPTGRFAASMVFDNKRSLLYIWGGETTTGFGDNRMYILKVQSNTGSGRTEWLETLSFNSSSSVTPGSSVAPPSGGVNVGAIAGGVAGGCVLLLVAGGAVFWMTRRKRTPTVCL